MPLSSFIMLSTQLKCTFSPPSGCLEHKASVLCVNQHIDRVEGYICTGGAELHLLYYNEFIVLKNPQRLGKNVGNCTLLKKKYIASGQRTADYQRKEVDYNEASRMT